MSADFLDSNVFVYMFDETDDDKRNRAVELVQAALGEGSSVISFQVVQEVLNAVTTKLKTPVKHEDARDFLEQVLAPLWRVMPSSQLYARAHDLRDRYRYGFYDSLIIAAALEAGCSRLYSEDLHDGQRIEGLRILNPFRS